MANQKTPKSQVDDAALADKFTRKELQPPALPEKIEMDEETVMIKNVATGRIVPMPAIRAAALMREPKRRAKYRIMPDGTIPTRPMGTPKIGIKNGKRVIIGSVADTRQDPIIVTPPGIGRAADRMNAARDFLNELKVQQGVPINSGDYKKGTNSDAFVEEGAGEE